MVVRFFEDVNLKVDVEGKFDLSESLANNPPSHAKFHREFAPRRLCMINIRQVKLVYRARIAVFL